MQVEAWLERAARIAPDATALEAPHARLSYAELWSAARAGACELATLGAAPGSRVAIALAPGVKFAQALHACFLLGAAAVPVDLRLTAAERERRLAGVSVVLDRPLDMPAAAARSESAGREAVDDASRGRDGVGEGDASPGSSRASTGNASEGGLPSAQTHDLDAVCAVIHTSGTTSAPKPVELTYGNFLWSALGSGVALGVDPRERWLCALPLCHVGGLSILVRSAIYATTAVIHERFETAPVLAALREEGITLVSLVATTLARLLDAGLREPPHLRCALTGGGPVPAALAGRARAAGVPVLETYGLTECCSQAATAPLVLTAPSGTRDGSEGGDAMVEDAAVRDAMAGDATVKDAVGRTADEAALEATPGAGVPLFCTRVRIAPDGEIVLAGPTVARSALAEDGLLHTGDLGRIDDAGFLHVTGRKSDTIVSGGENVAPSEVEAVLEAFPGVLEAAVVGCSDPQWGEAVTAIVVTSPGADVAASSLREHCSARLAAFKVPKRVELVSEPLPRTASGKLLRRELQGILR